MASQPLLPLRQLLDGKDVVQAEKRDGVDNTGQTGPDGLAHPPGGAVRGHQVRIVPLQLLQFPIETVIFLIRDDRCRQNVIGMTGLVEEPAQFE